MLCKPNKWSDSSFGGYLENKIKRNSIITGSLNHKHTTQNKQSIYSAINYLNSIKFNINKDLLHFIKNEGNYLLDREDKTDKSYHLQRDITLKLAELYANVPFYLTVNSDWRGRLYTQSFFITYQGSDLSLALNTYKRGWTSTFLSKIHFIFYLNKLIEPFYLMWPVKFVNTIRDMVISIQIDLFK